MKTTTPLRTLVFLIAFVSLATWVTTDAFARAGGGRSFGNRGSRSVRPSAPRYNPPSHQQNSRSYQTPPVAPAPAAPAGGGFLRSFGAGLAGGLVGGMLFRGLGGGGAGYGIGGGGGIGFLDIILLAGLIYLIYRLFKNRFMAPSQPYSTQSAQGYPYSPEVSSLPTNSYPAPTSAAATSAASADFDLSNQAPLIDRDTSLDIFFRIQGAFANRDLSSVRNLLSSEAATYLGEEVENLKRNRRINKLENIAVRDAIVSEQWQESGNDWATIQFTANVIDYTIDENTQNVVEGSKTSPVRFEEYWTVTRPSGSGPSDWKLTAISQVN